jgi:ribosomal protein L34E
MTLTHAGMTKNLQGILALTKKQPIGRTSYRHVQKVMKIPQIHPSELTVQSINNVLEQSTKRSSQDNIIHVKKNIGNVVTIPIDEYKEVSMED